MAKVAIKNVNITSFGGIYHIMDVFSKLGFERQGRQGGQATDGYVRSNIHIPLYPHQQPDIYWERHHYIEKDIINFYNERGASEKNFDIQNNDFGWSHLPFSFMAENMVFMMVTAMLKNFYLYLVRHISDKVKPLKKTSRLKAFILHFVSVPAKWVRTGRQNVLNLYTNKTYYAEVFIE